MRSYLRTFVLADNGHLPVVTERPQPAYGRLSRRADGQRLVDCQRPILSIYCPI